MNLRMFSDVAPKIAFAVLLLAGSFFFVVLGLKLVQSETRCAPQKPKPAIHRVAV